MKKIIQWLWWNYAAPAHERYYIMWCARIDGHRGTAKYDNHTGHTNECCSPRFEGFMNP